MGMIVDLTRPRSLPDDIQDLGGSEVGTESVVHGGRIARLVKPAFDQIRMVR
jgi:hypothetical protein